MKADLYKLLQEAKDEAHSEPHKNFGVQPAIVLTTDEFLKYTELVVRECAEACYESNNRQAGNFGDDVLSRFDIKRW